MNLNVKQISQKQLAKQVIKNLEARNMEAYYCDSSEDACNQIISIIKEGSSISWGGSETIKEIGLMDLIKKGNYILYDRTLAKTPEESRKMYANHVMSDYFLMSSNAITYDGQLVNIDGNGNRTSCLIHGPKNVFVIVGMNKLVETLDMAISRAKNCAAPPNAIRLNRDTPCKNLGQCVNCQTDDCMCCNTVITRRSNVLGRIKVVLINENLGY